MSRVKIKFVHSWIDKRCGGARARHYFVRRGFARVPLPGLPGSEEFMEAYRAALAGQTLPRTAIGVGRNKTGSVSALIADYYTSGEAFLSLGPTTRRAYHNILERFRNEHGDKPVRLLTRNHLIAMLGAKRDKPTSANHWLRLMKSLLQFAVEQEYRQDNPAIDIKKLKNRTEGIHTWDEEQIEQFEVAHPIGSKPRLAFALLLYTAQRRSDVIRMGRQHVRNDMISVRQQKTGAALMIPMHPELAAIIAATPSEHLTFLTTAYGHPFSAAGFGNWFRAKCDEAGLPQRCVAHGLRKAACRRLAEAGCSANVIASISGHASLSEVSRYTKAADQQQMARLGMAQIQSRNRQ